jgi:hypothetical protein
MPERDDPTAVLDASVTAIVEDGDVDLSFSVRNPSDEPIECSFRDGQRVEAVAERDDGAEVWRYGDDRMFSMALGAETIAPGGETTFDATWPDPEPGEYRIRMWLVATAADASAETRVSVA